MLENGQATVTAKITNTGHRTGTDVVQLYVGDPASAGEPPHQLKGFQRVPLGPGQSATVTFSVSAYDLSHWVDQPGEWEATSGAYQILVGDSSRNLPLSGTITVGSTIETSVLEPDGVTSGVKITNPGGMNSLRGQGVRLQIAGTRGLAYSATGLPPGLSISKSGLISGVASKQGTWTITVTGSSAADRPTLVTFVWTVS